MNNLISIKDRQLFIQTLPENIANNMQDHFIYFITITFTNTHCELPRSCYANYFKGFYQKLNQKSMNHPSKYPQKKCKMILVPEKSHHVRNNNMNKVDHYHGFLMIHQFNHQRFCEKCVYNVTREKESGRSRILYHLLNDIIHQDRTEVKAHSVNVEPIVKKEDVNSVCGYITKGFLDKKSKNMQLSCLDIKAYQESQTHSVRATQQALSNYDDVLYFCDISSLKQKHKISKYIN